jgi:crotonobetainyl-CoA:carnitine CoA-transferase CaiB-like acyl-CoA transferase
MNYLISGKAPVRRGNKHPNIQPQDVFASRNGYIALAVGNDGQFLKFCEVIGRAELAHDDRYATNASRVRNEPSLTPLIASILAQKDTNEWVELFDAAGVPCGPINTVPEVFKDPQVVDRQMLIELDHPRAGKVPLVASPMRFKESPLVFKQSPPTLGQHNKEILSELSTYEDEINAPAAGSKR